MCKKTIYRLDENISFRKCSLFNAEDSTFGDCTTPLEKEKNFNTYYICKNHGIHLHCTRHPEIELEIHPNKTGLYTKDVLYCPICKNNIEFENIEDIRGKCLRYLNIPIFKDAQLIRLDDWYTPEIKQKVKIASPYWMHVNIKEDKDGHSIIILYIGNKNSDTKTQIFIKPEKGQLTHDYHDIDPSTLISKIEVTLKNKKLIQQFEDEE